MTIYRVEPDYYYTSNNDINRNYRRRQRYVHMSPNNRAYVTSRSTNGQYNIIEKNFDDHKVLYYVPTKYENDYKISQLDEPRIYEERQLQNYSPTIIKQTYYEQYDDNVDDSTEELQVISIRRHPHHSPRRPEPTKTVYYEPLPPTPQTVEHIYEDDDKSRDEEVIEYILRDRASRQRYIEQAQPINRTVYIENPPFASRSSDRIVVFPQSPSRTSLIRLHEIIEVPSSSRLKVIQPISPPRTSRPSTNRKVVRFSDEPKHLSLQEIVAQNRARRGSRIPKPRREVDEKQLYDKPTYNKHFVKNGFMVHK